MREQGEKKQAAEEGNGEKGGGREAKEGGEGEERRCENMLLMKENFRYD